MIRLPSISSVKRIEECPGSTVFKVTLNESGDAAERGDVAHKYNQARGEGASEKEALSMVPAKHHKWCKSIDWQSICEPLVKNRRFEVAYALDLESETARELGVNLARIYPPTSPMEVHGTLDVEGQQEDGTWCYHEVKSGGHVGHPRANWQARFFAAVLMYRHGVDQVWVRIFYIKDDGDVEPEEHLFTAEELSSVVPDLIRIRNSIAKAQLEYDATGKIEVSPGEHCRFCPAKLACPAQYARLGALVRAMPEVAKIPVEQMSWDEIGLAWEIVDALGFDLKALKKSLSNIIGSQGLDLPNGQIVLMVQKKKYDVCIDRVFKLARQYGATEEELSECTTSYKYCYPQAFGKKKAG